MAMEGDPGISWTESPFGPFGVELSDVNLAEPLQTDMARRIVELFDQHKLLVVREQDLSEHEHARLLSLFGPVLGSKGEYREISSDGNLGAGPLDWHSDLAFTEKPFKVISLFAKEVNDGQSWTAFANGITTCATLPAALAQAIKGREARTVISMIQTHRAVGYDVPDFLPQIRRPMVIPHPRTGEQVLYINQMQTARIDGLEPNASDGLLSALFRRLYDETAIYRHYWKNGDLLIWDNIALQHSRCDLAGMHPRRMQRIVCADKSFFELLPQFDLADPRIAAWGSGQALDLEGDTV